MNDQNIPPTVSDIGNQVMSEDTPLNIKFTVNDTEGGSLKITAASSNAGVIPDDNTHISINGFGKEYMLETQAG